MLTNRQGITMIHQKVNLFIFYAHILEAACTEALNFNQTCYSWLKFLSINPEWWHFHIDFWRYMATLSQRNFAPAHQISSYCVNLGFFSKS